MSTGLKPSDPLTALKGVGDSLAAKLTALGLRRIRDLLLHLPQRYEDRTMVTGLGRLVAGREALIQAEILSTEVAFSGRRSLKVQLGDGSGFASMRLYHFSRAQQERLRSGLYLRAFGTPQLRQGGLELVHPEYQTRDGPFSAPVPELTPVYPTTKGITQARLRKLAQQALDGVATDPRTASDWPLQALSTLHRPQAEATSATLEAAQQQLALDELTAYFLIMQLRAQTRATETTLALPSELKLGRELLKRLGFQLTDAQKRALTDVLNDLSQTVPMLRLIQGDVGSGKTIVAAFAAVRAAEHGAQTAVMAPTEILAEQHYLNFSEWLSPLGIEVALLTGSLTAREKRARLAALAEGRTLVVVGTHALFQDGVEFDRLGLTIIDEQHRFGVHQRMALRDKGRLPHQLILTATPIPRTLTMALYADMAVSVIDELPKGRQPITTAVISNERRAEVLDHLRAALTDGQQAYWVCTLIEASEQLPASAAEPVWEELTAAFPDRRVGLLHGRMGAADKAQIMQAFKDRELDVLVATTVIEVGVDVPNASLMVIEDPNRLGLAQLHQLRGRVGRGSKASHCVLLYKSPLSNYARQRLTVIRDSQDGFYIAEQDLKLRGPGELLGARQTGEQQFRIADLGRDAPLIPKVLERGQQMLDSDPAACRHLLSVWAPADTSSVSV
ncbi:MAG: ATP-dependent DNA helicase RecG [Pseudomonadota bacterium]